MGQEGYLQLLRSVSLRDLRELEEDSKETKYETDSWDADDDFILERKIKKIRISLWHREVVLDATQQYLKQKQKTPHCILA